MIHYFSGRFALLTSVVASLLFSGGAFGIFFTFSVGGDTSTASIQDTVNSFRAALGDPNNGNAAGTVGGRREINWDGGGSATTISPGHRRDNVRRLPEHPRCTLHNSRYPGSFRRRRLRLIPSYSGCSAHSGYFPLLGAT